MILYILLIYKMPKVGKIFKELNKGNKYKLKSIEEDYNKIIYPINEIVILSSLIIIIMYIYPFINQLITF